MHRLIYAIGCLTVSVLFLLSGCHQDREEGNPIQETKDHLSQFYKSSTKEPEYVPIALPKGRFPALDTYRNRSKDNITERERQDLEKVLKLIEKSSRELAPHEARIMATILKAKTWEEVDEAVRKELSAARQNPLSFRLEQYAAHMMLTVHLLAGEVTAEKKDAIAFYVMILLENENPNAELIFHALTLLEDKWSKQEIRQAALNAASYAREYLKQTPCRPCLEQTGLQPQKVNELIDLKQQRLYKIFSAIPKLEALVK